MLAPLIRQHSTKRSTTEGRCAQGCPTVHVNGGIAARSKGSSIRYILCGERVGTDKEDVAETGPLATVLAAVKWLVARLASPAGTS